MKITILILSIFICCTAIAQEVVGVVTSTCDPKSDPEYIYTNRLISKQIENDTLLLQIGIVRNCAFEPRIELSQKSDSLIIEINNVSEMWMGCVCCFEMDIKAVGVKDTNFVLVHKYTVSDFTKNGLKEWFAYSTLKPNSTKYIFPSNYEIEQLPPNNLFNKDSLKIGPWHIYDNETKKLKAKIYYLMNEEGKSIVKWYARFDDQGELIDVCGQNGVDSEGKAYMTCASKEQFLKLEINAP